MEVRVIGNGSVIQREKDRPRSRCRRWELSVVTSDGAGVRKRRTRAFRGTWTEAQAALREFAAELDGSAPPSGWTVADYARKWHEGRAGALAHNTHRAEGSRVARIARHFGDTPLSAVDADAVRGFHSSMKAEGLAASTVRLADATLRTMLSDAARSGDIASPALEAVPKPKGGETGRQALTDAEMDALASRLDTNDGYELAALLCMQCGLRRAEAVAVEWRDVSDGCIRVERSDAGDGTCKGPKTRAGVRIVPVPNSLAVALEELRGEPSERVCLNAYGEPFSAGAFGAWWRENRGRLGTDVTLHELRHSYLTRLARAGVHPSVMQKLAGHSTMRVTMEIYTHVNVDMERDAVIRAFG